MSNIDNEDSYRAGRRDEQIRQEDNYSFLGLLIGFLVFLGVGGIAFGLFRFNRSEPTVAPVVVPSVTTTSPPAVENRETIIREKSTEKIVPVPVSPSVQPDDTMSAPSAQPSADSSSQPNNEASQPSKEPSPNNETSLPSPLSSSTSNPSTSAPSNTNP